MLSNKTAGGGPGGRGSRPARALVVLALAGMLAGCGVSTESNPQTFNARPTPTASPSAGRITRSTELFLVAGNRLIAVQRQVPEPVTMQNVISALLDGPTAAEGSRGIRSALPSSLEVHHAFIKGDTAIINLSSGLSSASTDDQVLALAQLVYTATVSHLVSNVQILVDGKPIQVPRADGSLTDGLVSRSDYAALLARPSSIVHTVAPRAAASRPRSTG